LSGVLRTTAMVGEDDAIYRVLDSPGGILVALVTCHHNSQAMVPNLACDCCTRAILVQLLTYLPMPGI
jgi:hypothetical protein